MPTCPSVSLAQMGLPPSTHVVCSEGPGVPLGELHMGCGWSACIQLGGISDHPCPSQHALLCHRGHPAHHHVCLMSFRTGRGRLELSGVRAPGPGCPAGAASPGPTLPSSPFSLQPHSPCIELFSVLSTSLSNYLSIPDDGSLTPKHHPSIPLHNFLKSTMFKCSCCHVSMRD